MKRSIKVEKALHKWHNIQHEAYQVTNEYIPNNWSNKLHKKMKVIEGKYSPYDTIKILSSCKSKDAFWSLRYLNEKYDDVVVFDASESEVLGYLKEAMLVYKGILKDC